jgi:hypothetical protein
MAATTNTITEITPNPGKKMLWVKAVSAADDDTCTISGLDVVQSAMGISTTGVPLSCTITGSSAVITLQNGGALTWNILVVGY